MKITDIYSEKELMESARNYNTVLAKAKKRYAPLKSIKVNGHDSVVLTTYDNGILCHVFTKYGEYNEYLMWHDVVEIFKQEEEKGA
jgi:hypothetical protein